MLGSCSLIRLSRRHQAVATSVMGESLGERTGWHPVVDAAEVDPADAEVANSDVPSGSHRRRRTESAATL